MKKIHSKITQFMCLLILLIGCTQDSDIKIPNSERVLVLHSILNPDTTISATLTTTRGIATKEKIEEVKGAKVELFEDGFFINNLVLTPPNLDKGEIRHKYLLDYQPKEGKEYKIIAQKDGFDSVEGTTTIPPKSGLINKVEILGEFEHGLKNIKLTIKDTDNDANYYHMVMYVSSEHKEVFNSDTITYMNSEYPSYYELKNTSIGDGLAEDNRYGFAVWSDESGYVFDDELFNNSTIVYNTNVYLPDNFFDGGNFLDFKSTLRIELRAVNKEYYKYYRSLSLQQDAKDNALAEPVFLYNNIERGFGNISGSIVVASEEVIFD